MFPMSTDDSQDGRRLMSTDDSQDGRRLMSTDGPRNLHDAARKRRVTPDGVNIRVLAPTVHAITNVTALVGRDLEPLRCHIYIRDGLIAAIVPDTADTTPLAAAPPPAKDLLERSKPITIDGKHMIAVPGMVDVHDHLRVLAPGLPVAEGLPLDEFLKVQWATQAHMAAPDYEVAALLGTLQRLKCGVTTAVDHAYTFHEPDLDGACVNAYESSGIRWAYARGIMTRPLRTGVRDVRAGGRQHPGRPGQHRSHPGPLVRGPGQHPPGHPRKISNGARPWPPSWAPAPTPMPRRPQPNARPGSRRPKQPPSRPLTGPVSSPSARCWPIA